MSIRTNRAFLASLGPALLLWFVTAAVHAVTVAQRHVPAGAATRTTAPRSVPVPV